MAQLLRPAVDRSDRLLAEVRAGLEARRFEAWELHADKTAMLFVTSLAYHNDRLVLWINYIGGSSRLKPKAWLKEARSIVAEIETLARRAGCRELRFGGRHWPLPGYEQYDAQHPGWVRKVLTDG